MPNELTLFKKYTPILDEVYKMAGLTSKLDGAESDFKAGNNANEVIVQKMSMQGLSKYDRAKGYTQGTVTLTPETLKYNYERGRMFSVDTMDNEETAGLAFGKLAGEFIRTQVAPEIDTVRFAKYSSMNGIINPNPAELTGDAWYKAISQAMQDMTDAEVPLSDRHLFITAFGNASVKDMDLTKSQAFMSEFASVTVVPTSRFITAVNLKEDAENGGFAPASGANKINFMIIYKPALIQTLKHVDAKVITPQMNQDADAWKFGYRVYGLNAVYENKAKGIYLHRSTQTI